MKNFKDLSLPITEEEYRNDGALHYSTLAQYERGGVHAIPSFGEKKESPSLLFGSMVDTLITDGQEAFDSLYYVADFPEISEQIANVVKGLFNVYFSEAEENPAYTLNDVPDFAILACLDEIAFGKTWKAQTRIDKVRLPGTEYYRQLVLSQGKTVVSSEMYGEAIQAVQALKSAPATEFLFADDDSVERHYQLKFRGYVKLSTMDVVSATGLSEQRITALLQDGYLAYSCMADEIIVNHANKTVFPLDLKTSSHFEDEFYKSFIDWNYQIQARLYWRLIRAAMDTDPDFKNYKLDDYIFIVVNKKTLTPMTWRYPDTKSTVTLYYGKNKQIECRHPFIIGEELVWYLLHPEVTYDKTLSIVEPNNLLDRLNTL